MKIQFLLGHKPQAQMGLHEFQNYYLYWHGNYFWYSFPYYYVSEIYFGFSIFYFDDILEFSIIRIAIYLRRVRNGPLITWWIFGKCNFRNQISSVRRRWIQYGLGDGIPIQMKVEILRTMCLSTRKRLIPVQNDNH